VGGPCASRRSPTKRRHTGSRRCSGSNPSAARRVRPCIPSAKPPEMLEQIRRTIGEYNFAGQYQQMPAPQGGGMVKAAVVPDLRAQ